MLTIFNRTDVYSTYDKDKLKLVTSMLDAENIAYIQRMTKSEIGFDELGEAYHVYVHKVDADHVLYLINQTLFPNHN